jgi:non-ribosomal peptide synthetase-like protein
MRIESDDLEANSAGGAVRWPGHHEMRGLHQLFEVQVDRRPLQTAIAGDGVEWSYRELDARANRLAHYIRTAGAGPGQLIGLYCERSAHPIVGLLACLKAGAGYVPIDPSHPEERTRHIVEEAGIELLLTDRYLEDKAGVWFKGKILEIEGLSEQLAGEPDRRFDPVALGLEDSDLCYVIFTSGTTGRPKGVMTEHRGAILYVLAFNEACSTKPDDRIYQGFSLCFDGSVEEIWMAFSNGATLVVPTPKTAKFGNEVAAYLSRHQVTYFSTVPTCLATITDQVETLRQIVLSGERCPPDLVKRWARPGRAILNVYGPTEATVNTTVAVCRPGCPITIGKPLAGYELLILNEALEPLPPGAKGELFIGGETLARGYLNQPELTMERFLPRPGRQEGKGRRLYRTGDLVRLNDDGDLEFFGRIDGQIKIRGYRVELTEIEAVLEEHPQVRLAAVKLFERGALQELGAFCVPTDPALAPGRNELLAHLQSRLPDYMVPGFLDLVETLPRLASGKVDRSRLPRPATPLVREARDMIPPVGETEEAVAKVWAHAFGLPAVSVEDDFFLDLGGHSLLAARTITRLRDEFGFELAVRDTYQHSSVRRLASHIDSLKNQREKETAPKVAPRPSAEEVFHSVPRWERLTVVSLQVLAMAFFFTLAVAPMAILALPVALTVQETMEWEWAMMTLFLMGLMAWPLALAVALAGKWLIIGRYQAGRYPLWGFAYFRWWLATRLQALAGVGFLVGTPFMSLYARLMGAKVGRNVHFDSAMGTCWDLISIGNDTTIGADTQFHGFRVEDGMLILGRVDIGDRCFVGIHSAFGLDVRMGDDCRLDDQSLLPDGEVMAPGEARQGSPARPAAVAVPPGPIIRPSLGRKLAFGVLQLSSAFLLGLMFMLMGLALLGAVLAALRFWGIPGAIAALAAAVPLGVVEYCLFVALAKRILLPRARPGVYQVQSLFYVRKWLADGLIRSSRAVLLPLYTTLYMPPFLRLLGAKVGKRAELSTIWNFAPELLEIGPESFFADGSLIGGRRTYGGRFEIAWNRIGRRTFVGNSALLPVGACLGDGCLLGVASVPPPGGQRDGQDYLGSPAFLLPNRQRVGAFSDEVTYQPSRGLYVQRAIVDALRILIPGFMKLGAYVVGFVVIFHAFAAGGWKALLWVAPLSSFILGLAAILAVCALKWLVMGRFQPVVKPLWSLYVWLNEMVNGVYESVMAPALAPYLGTPFAAPLLRLIGCRIGCRTFIQSTLFSEFDLVRIDDYAALNLGSVIQNHLFEDRIMKSSYLRVGRGCSVGNMGVVLYDTEMQPGAVLGPLSLLMKGEALPPGSRWVGIPIQPVRFADQSINKSAKRGISWHPIPSSPLGQRLNNDQGFRRPLPKDGMPLSIQGPSGVPSRHMPMSAKRSFTATHFR